MQFGVRIASESGSEFDQSSTFVFKLTRKLKLKNRKLKIRILTNFLIVNIYPKLHSCEILLIKNANFSEEMTLTTVNNTGISQTKYI